MTLDEIKELASGNTERKGEGQLNLDLLVAKSIQKVCGKKRFWWRKRTLTFTTTASTATYDLTSSSLATTPSNAGYDVEEIISVDYIRGAQDVVHLEPIFDEESQIAVLAAGETGEPGSYFNDIGSPGTLRFDKIPAGTYTIRVTFWAMPNIGSTYGGVEQTSGAVPLVPAGFHYVIVDRVEYDILRRLYGPTDPKVVSAKLEYEESLEDLMAKNSFDVHKTVSFASKETAVRSTR